VNIIRLAGTLHAICKNQEPRNSHYFNLKCKILFTRILNQKIYKITYKINILLEIEIIYEPIMAPYLR
jgi:hypothetical protein